MKHTNRFSSIRLGYTIGMALIFIIANTVLCLLNAVLIDKFICIMAINICFFLVFVLLLIRKRLEGALPEFNYITYGKITFVILLAWIITFLCAMVAPDFFAPFILLPIVCSTVLDDSLSNAISLYMVVITAICLDYNIFIVLCYVTLVVFGNVLAQLICKKEGLERLYILILIFSITTVISITFYYFSFVELSLSILFFGLVDGFVACAVTIAIVPLFKSFVEKAQTTNYEEFLNPDYTLVQDIRKFSFIEYQHASRVSILSRKCAEAINANAELAACGGFYYRLGKIEGEPMIDNAIKIANDYCFPTDVIQILAEYGGIIYLPSSRESAIVHMVDSVVTKVELFDADSMSSTWNQNMVIYQTINELSQKGFYDNSGLSMNQFLVIRNILANEDILA